jgi:AcrR family transcriptional regulator
MARATDGTARQEGPRRSGLLQERSRRTRHELVRTALGLWTERGFERGVEETTVEEIALAAGVTKGTFYFHFAHKEDILLEMGIGTADAMGKAAQIGMQRDRPAPEILDALMALLARRVERAPRDAVARSIAEISRRAHDLPAPQAGAVFFASTFSAVAAYGLERGDLPEGLDADDFGAVLQAVVMDTTMRWARLRLRSLRASLLLHTRLVVAGASSAYPERPGRRSAVKRSS